jgi:hypothetical protein
MRIKKQTVFQVTISAQKDKNFLQNIMTDDKTWIYSFDPKLISSRNNGSHFIRGDRKKSHDNLQQSQSDSEYFLRLQNVCNETPP